ncbi:hypothetical protein HMPREF9420_0026 [Segatella salivae DSM 15606]|uniref:Uncharacterized protein n=1 Tax=Segatella salivae DSM 15606 TaxID=888832 RepID=E6MKK9_9BACT|nr:hypothetical protein HMPREF9420_0026 [Segatella salivae DSM 15606]
MFHFSTLSPWFEDLNFIERVEVFIVTLASLQVKQTIIKQII